MMKRLAMMIAVLGAALVLSSPAVYAAWAPSQKDAVKTKEVKEKWEAKRQELYKKLDLTDDQKKALEENKNQNREQTKALFQSIKDKKEQMRQELQSGQLNMDKINQLQNELKASQAQMLDSRLQGILEIRKILTPDQFKKFMAHMEEQKEHGKHERGEHKEER